jgi:hypothetical protein
MQSNKRIFCQVRGRSLNYKVLRLADFSTVLTSEPALALEEAGSEDWELIDRPI